MIEEQQRIMEQAQQKWKPASWGSKQMMSSSLDGSSRYSVAPPPTSSSSYQDANTAGVNPVYEYKYNRSRGKMRTRITVFILNIEYLDTITRAS